jgi:hypothetical protein
MCEGSIYVPHRQATDKEQLTVQGIPGLRMKGYYPATAGPLTSRLVCIRYTTAAIMKLVQFEPGLPAWIVQKWEGQCNVKVTLRHRAYMDTVEFPDGATMGLMNIASGVRVDIGIPVVDVVAKGMKVVEGAITEAMALPPDPKPEGEADAPSSEPPATEPAVNPVKEAEEPATTEPTAA